MASPVKYPGCKEALHKWKEQAECFKYSRRLPFHMSKIESPSPVIQNSKASCNRIFQLRVLFLLMDSEDSRKVIGKLITLRWELEAIPDCTAEVEEELAGEEPPRNGKHGKNANVLTLPF